MLLLLGCLHRRSSCLPHMFLRHSPRRPRSAQLMQGSRDALPFLARSRCTFVSAFPDGVTSGKRTLLPSSLHRQKLLNSSLFTLLRNLGISFRMFSHISPHVMKKGSFPIRGLMNFSDVEMQVISSNHSFSELIGEKK